MESLHKRAQEAVNSLADDELIWLVHYNERLMKGPQPGQFLLFAGDHLAATGTWLDTVRYIMRKRYVIVNKADAGWTPAGH